MDDAADVSDQYAPEDDPDPSAEDILVVGTREELAADDFTGTVDGEAYELTDGMVSFRAEPPENVASADFDVEVDGDRTGGTVYVDTSLTEEWDVEGVAVTIGIERLEAEQRAA
jgi:isoleucyl-tRNA synthetase